MGRWIGGFLVTVCALIGAPAEANAASYNLRPNDDVTSQWTVSGTTTAWEALDDDIAQPAVPTSNDYIYASTDGQATQVGLTSRQLAPGETPVAGSTAWFYRNGGVPIRAQVLWGGEVRGTYTIPGGTGYAWRSISVTPPDQAAVNGLRLKFTALDSGTSSNVIAAYFELVTNKSGSNQTLRPDHHITNQWNLGGGATSAWRALDDDVTSPTEPPAEEYAYSSSAGSTAEVGLATHELGESAPAAGTAWFYGHTAPGSSVKVEVVWGGSVRATQTIPGGSSYAWRSISVTPPGQGAVDDLRLRFTVLSNSQLPSDVFAAYFHLQTTASCTNLVQLRGPACTVADVDGSTAVNPITEWGSIDCLDDASRFDPTNERHAAIDAPTGGSAWFFGNVAPNAATKVDVIWGGSIRATQTFQGGSGGAGYAWRSIPVTPPNQAAIDDLRIRFTVQTAGSVSSNVFATYFELPTATGLVHALRPDADVTNQWDLGGAVTAWDALNEPVTHADTPPAEQFIYASQAGKIAQVSLTTVPLYPLGDQHVRASGQAPGENAYRRLTVFDTDTPFGSERCELGQNQHYNGDDGGYPVGGDYGTFHLYEGAREITFISYRLPASFPLATSRWQLVMQMKQANTSDFQQANPNAGPPIALQVMENTWIATVSDVTGTAPDIQWTTQAQTGVWTRFAFDVTYSTDPSIGAVKIYADLNGDGDAGDAGEQSPTFRRATVRTEIVDNENAGEPTNPDYLAEGDAIPNHLRVGLYHDEAIDCSDEVGCSVEVDNVEVVSAP